MFWFIVGAAVVVAVLAHLAWHETHNAQHCVKASCRRGGCAL